MGDLFGRLVGGSNAQERGRLDDPHQPLAGLAVVALDAGENLIDCFDIVIV
ncbi:MAG TPA: hypothetical protein PKC18_09450 [Lacipirellulaceae bacterium]|nr:hypothetical protein [Lacipirellulaceae bacterium]